MTQKIFTLTAGRTGTAWLASFLGLNQVGTVIHEPLGIGDFGTRMPEIRILREFNAFGNTATVQAFWRRKLQEIAPLDFYAETNHTLGKCGLIENLCLSGLRRESTVIVLRRDLARQCASYVQRGDFRNITIAWQWYLHPSYPLKSVNPEVLLQMGEVGLALWYCFEMAVRQEFYLRLYGSRIRMIEVQLEEAVRPDGARALWEQLGGAGNPVCPPPRNENPEPPNQDLVSELRDLVARLSFDPSAIADEAIAQGLTFESPVRAAMAPARMA